MAELKAADVRNVERSSPRRGAHALVYKAQLQINPGEWVNVALKTLPPANLTTGAMAMLRQELSLLSLAQSDHVVKCYGLLNLEDTHYIVMEWMEETLAEYLPRMTEWKARATVGLHIARALSVLPSQLLVHGDIKADNVLVDVNGVAKLCDFGLGRIRASVNSTHAPVPGAAPQGSPVWRAPELEANQTPREFADMFGFGLVLWALGSGQLPSHPHRHYSPLEIDPIWPSWLILLLTGCLVLDEPSRRTTAAEAVKKLAEVAEQGPEPFSALFWPSILISGFLLQPAMKPV